MQRRFRYLKKKYFMTFKRKEQYICCCYIFLKMNFYTRGPKTKVPKQFYKVAVIFLYSVFVNQFVWFITLFLTKVSIF